eukprot:Skav220388  [mRNA]  locus=scaffold639:162958:163281:+ [translate_table: standard]
MRASRAKLLSRSNAAARTSDVPQACRDLPWPVTTMQFNLSEVLKARATVLDNHQRSVRRAAPSEWLWRSSFRVERNVDVSKTGSRPCWKMPPPSSLSLISLESSTAL